MSAVAKGCTAGAVLAVWICPPWAKPPTSALCTPQPVLRADGTTGRFVQVVTDQEKVDPRYAGAVPANWAEGLGLTCDELPRHVRAGYLVGSDGKITGGKGDVHPYYRLRS